MMRLSVSTPAPEPGTPTVAAPAPVNLAAMSMSLEMALVWKLQLGTSEVRGYETAKMLRFSSVIVSGCLSTTYSSAAARCSCPRTEWSRCTFSGLRGCGRRTPSAEKTERVENIFLRQSENTSSFLFFKVKLVSPNKQHD